MQIKMVRRTYELQFVKVSPVQFVIESLEYNISKSFEAKDCILLLKRKFLSNNIQSSASILTEKTKKVEIT